MSTLDTQAAITIDIDWAPDFTIDFVADLLAERRVRATWFVTHDSPAVGRLRRRPDLFELGIHPNFLPGSTHGETADDVLRHCLSLVPGARSLRTHALVQSSPLLLKFLQSGIATDLSLFLPLAPRISPVSHSLGGLTMLRIPYFWEDSYEIEQASPRWGLAELLGRGPGLKVINFHPIHVYLNSSDSCGYREAKKIGPVSELTAERVAPAVCVGAGTRTLFMELRDYLAGRGDSARVAELSESYWRQEAGPAESKR